jgi:anti-sigma factor RsiW
MNCETARILTETNDPRLEEHLRSCPSCMVGYHARYYEAPPGLEEKIRGSLRREISPPARWQWMAIAASVLLTASVIGNVALLRSRSAASQVLADDVLSAHVRSLAGTHLLDVPSTDQHTVKPWFNGKLDFSPAVKEVEGFPLLGGRLEYFQGHLAAALVYGRARHIVNLFVWPSQPAADVSETRNGYHMQSWSAGGMVYWAVSDLNEAELKQFASLYRR